MLEWIFPNTCQLCGAVANATLCPACLRSLERVPKPVCMYCGAPVAGNQADPYHCEACRNKPRPFTFARSALYENDTTLSLVHDLKYHKHTHLAQALAPALAELWESNHVLADTADWALAPVPVTKRKLFSRGYNQAEELAEELAKLRPMPIIQPLQRLNTGIRSQTNLSATERMRNAYKAYALLPEYAKGTRTLPPNVLILDDVYTTGATTRACAHALRQAKGVRNIGIITLLRVQ
ncbi:MAG: double zinc ribbon domain-containing protein [Akkermansia sp.]|nr:double zinc ribbon domain-containing protein [Akkermansia sp.]